jgi:hypothetical protein
MTSNEVLIELATKAITLLDKLGDALPKKQIESIESKDASITKPPIVGKYFSACTINKLKFAAHDNLTNMLTLTDCNIDCVCSDGLAYMSYNYLISNDFIKFKRYLVVCCSIEDEVSVSYSIVSCIKNRFVSCDLTGFSYMVVYELGYDVTSIEDINASNAIKVCKEGISVF